ncbi:major capsid protein [Pseudomonas sp. 65/3-MNA-CIBAN-0223]|uniref:major capsid protein n=1 Tax=Pseudomonas sp. 65/3-MNA-CIBAN-0223 TaxID=3140476 RepID=UPI00332F1DCA
MKKAILGNTGKIASATALLTAAGASHAVDVAPVVASITEAGPAAALIGTAVLGVIVIIKTFKYIRSAF